MFWREVSSSSQEVQTMFLDKSAVHFQKNFLKNFTLSDWGDQWPWRAEVFVRCFKKEGSPPGNHEEFEPRMTRRIGLLQIVWRKLDGAWFLLKSYGSRLHQFRTPNIQAGQPDVMSLSKSLEQSNNQCVLLCRLSIKWRWDLVFSICLTKSTELVGAFICLLLVTCYHLLGMIM